MKDTLGRIHFDLFYSLTIHSSGKDQGADQMRFSWVTGNESHANLKCHACLLWNSSDWPTFPDHFRKGVEQLKHLGFTASEELIKTEAAARVPEIFGDEAFATFWTAPELLEFLGG